MLEAFQYFLKTRRGKILVVLIPSLACGLLNFVEAAVKPGPNAWPFALFFTLAFASSYFLFCALCFNWDRAFTSWVKKVRRG